MIIFKGYFSQAQNPLLREINSKKKKKLPTDILALPL